MLAISFYDVVKAIHVMAVVVGLGVVFAYPILLPYLRRNHPQSMPAVHAGQELLGKRLITPGLVVILLAGIYMASKNHYWDKSWVSIPLLILIVLGGLGGAYFGPRERKLSELARRDLDGGGALGEEYDALSRQVGMVGAVASALVLLAVFLMIAKPGGY